MLDYTGIIALGKEFPGKKANRFIEWFTYSDESIGGKSKTKAYAMFESSFFDSIEVGTTSDRKNLPNDSQTLFKKHITTNLFQDLEGLTNTIESYNCIEPLITRTSCGLQDLAGSLGCAISPLAAPRFFILE